jgi:hypothetical protein
MWESLNDGDDPTEDDPAEHGKVKDVPGGHDPSAAQDARA